MMKLVFVVLLVALAVASAQYVIPAYGARGAYGLHNAFAASSVARVDAPRNNLVAIGGIPLGRTLLI